MDVLPNQQWLLSLGTFLPLAGVLVMLFIPKRDEAMVFKVFDTDPNVPTKFTAHSAFDDPNTPRNAPPRGRRIFDHGQDFATGTA